MLRKSGCVASDLVFVLSQEKNPVSVHTYLISCIDLYVCVRVCSVLGILITLVLFVIFLSQTLFGKKLELN